MRGRGHPCSDYLEKEEELRPGWSQEPLRIPLWSNRTKACYCMKEMRGFCQRTNTHTIILAEGPGRKLSGMGKGVITGVFCHFGA